MPEHSRREWLSEPADPDNASDLEYDLLEWEVIRARKSGGERLVFLPQDESALKRDAFIVADEGSVCTLEDHR